MLKFIILLSTAVCALAATKPPMGTRIVGGANSTIEKHPYQIALFYTNSFTCGGSIISPNRVVTAAHCVHGRNSTLFTIRSGSTQYDTGHLTTVKKIVEHPEFNSYTMVNDVAILFLNSKLTLSTTTKHITLCANAPAANGSLAISGWGTLHSGATLIPKTLQDAKVSMITKIECASKLYGYNTEIKGSMICAAALGKDTCQGDSGGPLVDPSRKCLAGITSWGYGCAQQEYPGVYTNVALVKSWVTANI